MIRIKTNIKQFTEGMEEKFALLSNPEYLLRPVMFGLVDLMTKRIHIDGQAADGGAIGSYSTGYMRTRAKAGRQEGRKVVISLTRQLENAWSVEATQKGYGIGFINDFNYNKSQWVEETYKKPIFKMTDTEQAYALEYINDLVNEALK